VKAEVKKIVLESVNMALLHIKQDILIKQHFDNSSFKTTQLLHVTQNETFHWQTKLPIFMRSVSAKHNGTVVTTKIREALGFHLNQDTIYPY
jgi:hypothetical protein